MAFQIQNSVRHSANNTTPPSDRIPNAFTEVEACRVTRRQTGNEMRNSGYEIEAYRHDNLKYWKKYLIQ